MLALLAVLEATSNAHIASHILHLLCHCLGRADPPSMSTEQMQREYLAGTPCAAAPCLCTAAMQRSCSLHARLQGPHNCTCFSRTLLPK